LIFFFPIEPRFIALMLIQTARGESSA